MPPIFQRNSVGGAAAAPPAQGMPQQVDQGQQALLMAKLVRDMQAKQGGDGGSSGISNLFGGKSGQGGSGPGGEPQFTADSIGYVGGGGG
jgi:hypothetical protein